MVYDERLTPALGIAARGAWHAQALQALDAAEVVFADPDNGITEGARSTECTSTPC